LSERRAGKGTGFGIVKVYVVGEADCASGVVDKGIGGNSGNGCDGDCEVCDGGEGGNDGNNGGNSCGFSSERLRNGVCIGDVLDDGQRLPRPLRPRVLDNDSAEKVMHQKKSRAMECYIVLYSSI